MVKRSKNQNLLIFIVLTLIGFLMLGGSVPILMNMLSSPSYTTGYEGVHAKFAGVQWGSVKATDPLWATTLSWDADTLGSGKPKISGTMSSVFIPKESVGVQPSWIDPAWLLSDTNIKNPIAEYEWEIDVSGGTDYYRMEEWQLKWYVSLTSEPLWDEVESVSFPDHITGRNSLSDVKVWFELDLSPVWYFEGAERAYYAIAKLHVSDLAKGGVLKDGKAAETANSECRIATNERAILPLFYNLFGTQGETIESYKYRDQQLNPELFRDKMYTYLQLDDFGVTSWWDYGTWYRADSISIGIDVHVFVIGEWMVQDIQELPDEFGREAKTGGAGFAFGAWFADPLNRLIIFALIGLILFVLVVVFIPGIFTVISVLFRGKG